MEGFFVLCLRASKDVEEARETVLIPPDKYYFSPEIDIYDNRVETVEKCHCEARRAAAISRFTNE